MKNPVYSSLDDALWKMKNSDLLLFRGRSLVSVMGRGIYTHAAMFAWWEKEPFCMEVTQFYGGRAVHLGQLIKLNPGRIDVYSSNPGNRWLFHRENTVKCMRQLMGCHYGYRNIFRVALQYIPVLRSFFRPSIEDTHKGLHPPFCSQACMIAYREGGGVDPVPLLSDEFTEPNDLARSPFFEYQFTLLG